MGKYKAKRKKKPAFDKGKLIIWLYFTLAIVFYCLHNEFIVINRLYIELAVDSCIAITTAIIWLCKKESLSKAYIVCIAVFNYFMGWIIFYGVNLYFVDSKNVKEYNFEIKNYICSHNIRTASNYAVFYHFKGRSCKMNVDRDFLEKNKDRILTDFYIHAEIIKVTESVYYKNEIELKEKTNDSPPSALGN